MSVPSPSSAQSDPPALLVVGAGAHGLVVAELAQALGYGRVDFADDSSPLAIGPLSDLPALVPRYDAVAVSIGNLPFRQELLDRLEAIPAPLPPLVHPSAYVSPSAHIAPGALVLPGAVVNANAVVGKGAIVSAGAVVDHDAALGPCAHLDAGAVLAARAAVPPLTKIPAGSRVLSDTPKQGHSP